MSCELCRRSQIRRPRRRWHATLWWYSELLCPLTRDKPSHRDFKATDKVLYAELMFPVVALGAMSKEGVGSLADLAARSELSLYEVFAALAWEPRTSDSVRWQIEKALQLREDALS